MATGIPVAAAELVDLTYLNEVTRAHWRKTTTKTVNTTVAASDLLNGEITIDAGAMSATRALRLTTWGDWLNTSGGTVGTPRFQLVLGGTTLIDTGTLVQSSTSATRFSWKLVAEILNSSSASAQVVNFALVMPGVYAAAGLTSFTTGNGQIYVPTGGGTTVMFGEGVNTGAVNTALASALVLNVINGSASASYETKLFGALVEVV